MLLSVRMTTRGRPALAKTSNLIWEPRNFEQASTTFLKKSRRPSCSVCTFATVVRVNSSTTQGARVTYAGNSADDRYQGSTWRGKPAERSAAPAYLLPLQTDIFQLMSPEISELGDSAPPNGGGLEDDPSDGFHVLDRTCEDGGRTWQGEHGVFFQDFQALAGARRSTQGSTKEKEGSRTQLVGGLLSGLGDCDVVLVLDDGSRLPAHSCLLAAFSGTFRDVFLRRRNGRDRKVPCCASCGDGIRCSSANSAGALTGTSGACCEGASCDVGLDDQRKRSRDVKPLLVGRTAASEEANGKQPGRASVAVSETAEAAAAAFAATSTAENTVRQSPAVVEWKRARGDVGVRFWGVGTMAAIVRHVYTGQTPADVHVDGLGRLLVASVTLKMPRLMRQVEHLLSASLPSQKGNGNDRSAQLKEVGRLLRAARVLRATDLENRCTLYLQANGGFPEVMKVKCGCDSVSVVHPKLLCQRMGGALLMFFSCGIKLFM